jgi:hypothetical protein
LETADPINDLVLRSNARLAAMAIVVPVAIVNLPACANSHEKRPDEAIHASYDKSTGKLTELAYDSDHDGRVDTWTDMDGTRPLRSRIDRNGDGKIDRWEEYDAAGALVKVGFSRRDDGKADAWVSSRRDDAIERIEISSTGNEQKIDRWEYYDVSQAAPDGQGALVRAEEDTLGDGKPHKWETYRHGALETVAFDDNGDGVADRRFTYRGSALVLIESHPDRAGRFTVRSEVNDSVGRRASSHDH